MFSFFKRFFDYNQREIDRLTRIVKKIDILEDKARDLRDGDFVKETEKFRDQITSGKKNLDQILPWAFALVREASRRILGERHYPVQLMAGIALHEGKVIEQKTGEGKTLSATTALYLNSLSGKGTHLVTVNDYLARRDAGWMGQVFYFLGLKTAAMISDQSFLYDPDFIDNKAQDWRLVHLRPVTRKEAYQADITYGINSEFGFDYLRDNMATSFEEIVQRGFNYAIIDEADSVLIDEARTPHIISAPYEEDVSKYYRYVDLVNKLDKEEDYLIDEKLRTVHLTEKGIEKVEHFLGVTNVYEKNYETVFHIEAALKAKALFKIDKDYIVKDGQVIIVDEFTGRLLYGRRFSEGLHQAIEAKEGVKIQKESRTLATVSLQNYFRSYQKLAGMTGTAATEAEEFHKIYHTDVIVIPTNKPLIRQDEPDLVYKTERAKLAAIANEIEKEYRKGRPVLVGTTSIEKNEQLSRVLEKKGIPHQLLNAKNHLKEAHIIADAGKKGSVTVATNMAGRGVDIILGGESPNKYGFTIESGKMVFKKDKDYQTKLVQWRQKHDEIVKLGGLYVLGTERHESRRIDNQLRGRAGRQGDPGKSRFFVSIEDDLMRIFGGEQIGNMMNFLKFPEDQPISHSMVSKAIEQAQVKVEGFNFDIRKHLVEYDDVLNRQREIIYRLRRNVLHSEKNIDYLDKKLAEIFIEVIGQITNSFFGLQLETKKTNINLFLKEVDFIRPSKAKIIRLVEKGEIKKLQDYLNSLLMRDYQKKIKAVGKNIWLSVVRSVFLSIVDKYWTEHLTAIDDLREGINLRGYAQLDPLVEYKNEAFSMFEKLISDINFEITRRLLSLKIETGEEQAMRNQSSPTGMVFKSASAINPFSSSGNNSNQPAVQEQANLPITPPGKHKKKIGRNDPCWCGSGKKWKKCHYPELPPD